MIKGYKNLKLVNIFSYDTSKYNFREAICKSLNNNDLENLHKKFDYFLLERNKDQSTAFHKKFYENYNDCGFKQVYERFIKEFWKGFLQFSILVIYFNFLSLLFLRSV